MNTDLGPLITSPKTGCESFCADATPLGYTLKDFWIWSVSDLVSNATRGRLAEFIVAKALGIATDVSREEWEAFDLKTMEGKKIEVKSAAYIQSWNQSKLSSIIFSTRKTRYWDSKTNIQERESKRQADVYVFALLTHLDKKTINPLNVKQWEFYVLSTPALGNYKRSEVSITLSSLKTLKAGPVNYDELAGKVKDALAANPGIPAATQLGDNAEF